MRWWLSGGVALDHWLGRSVRERSHTDASTTPADVRGVIEALPSTYSVWAPDGEDAVIPWADAAIDSDLQPLRIRDERTGAWVLQLKLEDGDERAWLYRRDPRLQLPWDRAVLDVGGISTGAPEIQLLWKALRPRREDDVDKDAVLPELSKEARAWFERATLSIHPTRRGRSTCEAPSRPRRQAGIAEMTSSAGRRRRPPRRT